VQYTRAARARRTWRGAAPAALAALIALADRIGHEHAWAHAAFHQPTLGIAQR